MKPFAWYGSRLLCTGKTGRIFIAQKSAGLFSRWWYRKLPRRDMKGKQVGIGSSILVLALLLFPLGAKAQEEKPISFLFHVLYVCADTIARQGTVPVEVFEGCKNINLELRERVADNDETKWKVWVDLNLPEYLESLR